MPTPPREPTDEELQQMRRQVVDWIQRQEAEDAAKRAARTAVASRRGRAVPPATASAPAPVPPLREPAQPAPTVEKPKPQRRARSRPKPGVSAPPAAPQPKAPSQPTPKPLATPPAVSSSWPKPVARSKPKDPPAAGKPRWLHRIVVAALSGFLIGAVVGPAIAIYGFGATGGWVTLASRLIPFPAAYVNTRLVRYSDFLDDYAALRAYARGTAAAPTAVREQVLQKLIADALVEQLALEQRVEVDPSAVPSYVGDLEAELGGRPALEQRLREDFHLDLATFIRRVVQPHLLRQALVAALSVRPEVREATADNAEALRQQIASGELEFSAVASRYSQDLAARVGGDLGYLAAGELTAAVGEDAAKVVGELSLGRVSDVVETPDEFSLYRVSERLAGTAGEPTRLRVWRIVLRPQESIEAVVHDAAAKARVVRFVR